MPLYDVKCNECGKITEVFAKMSETKFVCQSCGCKAEKQVSGIVTERRFAGSEMVSARFRFIPAEVNEKRKMMGDSGNCIQDSGEVRFSNRSEERKFRSDFFEKVYSTTYDPRPT